MGNITIKPELNSKANKDGLYAIVLRLTQNGNHKRITLPLTVPKKSFNRKKAGEWVTKHPEEAYINQYIIDEISKYNKAYINPKDDVAIRTKEDLAKSVQNVEYKDDYIAYFKHKKESLKEYNNEKGFGTTLNYLQGYLSFGTLPFKDITKEWLEDFEEFLNEQPSSRNKDQMLSPSTIHTQLKRVRSIYNNAIQDKIIPQSLSPFGRNGYLLPSPTNTKVLQRLDKDELGRLFKKHYDKDADGLIYYVHKAFCLSFLTAGMRIEDIMTLKWSNIKNGQLSYNMKKGSTGGTQMHFGVNAQMKPILDELRPKEYKDEDYIFPFLKKGIENKENETYKKEIASKTAIYNAYLKDIADDIYSDKKITSHIARHTWAAIMYEETNNIKLIQENLGHKDIKTTINYIGRLSTKKNDEALTSVYGKIF